MLSLEAINKAINTHALWKRRLVNAIETGKSEFQTTIVQKDNLCEFGKWLEGLPSFEKHSEEFKMVKELHTAFHKSAANVLDLALKGKKEEAKGMLNFNGTFGEISSRLAVALGKWKKNI